MFAWYIGQNVTGKNYRLADEWAVFIRVVLDNIALRDRENVDHAYNNRKQVDGEANVLDEFKWCENIINNRRILNFQ